MQPCKSQLATRKVTGFTLVELLVVITIIGILMSLLLPAVNSARESARRLQCGNNIKQLATACCTYEGMYDSFPPAVEVLTSMTFKNNGMTADGLRENWIMLVLPHMDQLGLYNDIESVFNDKNQENVDKSITTNLSITLDSGREIKLYDCTAIVLPTLCCPTDTNARNKFKIGSKQQQEFARGNYGINTGTQTPGVYKIGPMDSKEWNAGNKAWANTLYRGVTCVNRSQSQTNIRDGLSNTILLSELRAGLNEKDPRGVWSLGIPGASLTAANGWFGDDYGPNCMNSDSDDIWNCSSIANQDRLIRAKLPCDSSASSSSQATSRSAHSGGVQIAFCDGSVHWIADTVQCAGNKSEGEVKADRANQLTVWDKLILSNDQQSIKAESY